MGCQKGIGAGAQGALSKVPRVPGTPDLVSWSTHLDKLGNLQEKGS